MHTCPECGNGDMTVRLDGGTPIHECGLCGARFGDRRTIEAIDDAEEARARGVSPLLWPLVRALDGLLGLVVRLAEAGDPRSVTLPFVELGVANSGALVQLENLAKSLQISAGALRCPWVVEVEFRRHLAFVLKPRIAGDAVTAELVHAAQIDVGVLRQHLERNMRLGWWRHAGGAPTG